MKSVKFPRLHKEIDAEINYSFVASSLTFIIGFILIGLLSAFNASIVIISFSFIVITIIGIIIRGKLSDVSTSSFIENEFIYLDFDQIELIQKVNKTYKLDEIEEFLYFKNGFYNEYFEGGSQTILTGNNVLFLKLKSKEVLLIKFRIGSYEEYKVLKEILKEQNKKLLYFKEYPITELNHILNDTKTARRKFN